MAAKYPDRGLAWPIIWPGVELVAETETCALKAYLCPAGKPTLAWGQTEWRGSSVRLGMTCTQIEADTEFRAELTRYAVNVVEMCEVRPDDHELAALVALAWNIGLESLRGSTVMRCHNRGDKQGAANAFKLWNKARVNGVLTVLDGLVTRRAREAALYLTPDDHALAEPLPQAVASESRLVASPIVQGGAATAAAGVATVASVVEGDTLERVQQLAAQAGVSLPLVLGVVLVVAGAVVVFWRARQRKEGWA